MTEKAEKNYKFHNPLDTGELLRQAVKKIGLYEWHRQKKKEIQREWRYESKFALHPALIFSKLIPWATGENKEENKHRYLELVINSMEKNEMAIGALGKRITNYLNITQRLGYLFGTPIDFTLSWRMVIGLGASHPQETSMALHHVYGIPYIPGSAVKGSTRHWIIRDQFDGEEDKAMKNHDFKRVFGTPEQEGEVIFLDAYPIEKVNLKVDIMNPHYPDYYGKEKPPPPGDWQNPVPIKFLTIERTKFRFYLLGKEKTLIEKVKDWVEGALKNYGIGAKTSSGYGYFE